jgi:hypothetical protein
MKQPSEDRIISFPRNKKPSENFTRGRAGFGERPDNHLISNALKKVA